MSRADDYVRCAEAHARTVAAFSHAADCGDDFANDDFSGWKVTGIYYTACLLVKAYAHTQGKAYRSHQEVRDFLHDRRELDPMRKDYLYLENESREARHEGQTFTVQEIKADIVPSFEVVFNTLRTLLSKNGVAVPSITHVIE